MKDRSNPCRSFAVGKLSSASAAGALAAGVGVGAAGAGGVCCASEDAVRAMQAKAAIVIDENRMWLERLTAMLAGASLIFHFPYLEGYGGVRTISVMQPERKHTTGAYWRLIRRRTSRVGSASRLPPYINRRNALTAAGWQAGSGLGLGWLGDIRGIGNLGHTGQDRRLRFELAVVGVVLFKPPLARKQQNDR